MESLHVGRVNAVHPVGSGEWWDKSWETGFYKEPVQSAVWLGYEGFRGDEQADRRFHGGSEKAVCVYPAGHYPYWRSRLEKPDLAAGAFGENLTVSGLDEVSVFIGDIFRLGEAVVQVSQPRQPCWKLARRWRVKDLAAQVERTGFTGYYFRVLHHGFVREQDRLVLEQRPFPEWSIQRCNGIMHGKSGGSEAARQLAECPALSASWKDGLWARSQRPVDTDAPGKSNARTSQPE